MTDRSEPPALTVLAVGNSIMGDDGVGLELLAALRVARPDPRIDYVEGGVGGLELLPVVQDCRRLLILDAVTGGEPGTVRQLEGDQVPRLLQSKLSPHQVGLLDVLSAARLLRQEPEALAVVGVAPQSVELRLGLSPVVAAAVPAAVARAAAVVDRWLA
ncbi:MAG: hydrogenase maturation protease [Propionibacteriaceae bacterium]|jgi:hydrogenase maturation protease|nr:hydrogenase maturation protease [Propionibacteriaceae bacterium]